MTRRGWVSREDARGGTTGAADLYPTLPAGGITDPHALLGREHFNEEPHDVLGRAATNMG